MSGVLEIAHELIESFLVLRFAEAGQVGVKGGHRRALVPEIDLDLAQVLSLLKAGASRTNVLNCARAPPS